MFLFYVEALLEDKNFYDVFQNNGGYSVIKNLYFIC